MNLSEIYNRCKLGLTSAALVLGLVSGSANADLDPGSLFFMATDESRNGTSEAYILNLNLNFLTNDPAGFSGITDQAAKDDLRDWLNDPNASSLITWGVFGVGSNTGSAAEVRIASTVNPVDVEPGILDQTPLLQAITAGKDVVSRFNDANVGDRLSAPSTTDGFPVGFGNFWGDNSPFKTTGGLEEQLPMYIFGLNEETFQPIDPIDVAALWKLDVSTGSLELAAVPVPAAVWMFGSALVGLFGIRRRSAG